MENKISFLLEQRVADQEVKRDQRHVTDEEENLEAFSKASFQTSSRGRVRRVLEVEIQKRKVDSVIDKTKKKEKKTCNFGQKKNL